MPWPEHVANDERDQHVLWVTPAVGCLLCVALLWGSCHACEAYYAPARLAAGEYRLSIEGDLQGLTETPTPGAWAGRAWLDRSGRWTGPVYHSVFLQRPDWDAGLSLRTKNRPKPGSYVIVRHDLSNRQGPETSFDGIVFLTNNAATFFESDSGILTIRRESDLLVGTFRMHVSRDPRPAPGEQRHLLFVGEFTLK
jgi:hypothetical protein